MSARASSARGLRTGFTTGACAAAAAKAAATAIVTGTLPSSVEIVLPGGQQVAFAVESDRKGTVSSDSTGTLASDSDCGQPELWASAVVVKDAGDDPDCTNGARVTATVAVDGGLSHTDIRGGEGVGTVTKPGLGLPVGSPAINPVPRKMILAAVSEVTSSPLAVTISVPGGEEMARKTTNARLGIIGGISILGTTGIVKPFSTAAYRASVVQQVDVAAAQGERSMVLCTGSRSELAARALYPDRDDVCLVEVGDFSGIALRRCALHGMTEAAVVAMVGKITKLAAGVMMTHFHRSKVDVELLERVALETSAPPSVVAASTETATARHFYEACRDAGAREPLDRLCQLARASCEAHTAGKLRCPVTMVDFEGREVVASA